ncbi:hypothetical protein, partial [Bradyrhizobium sp. HKCCYLRH1062]|uniref:hypothetical protein n=1 Tax=unclassified Bradyrhizobium TaxID=2631580 RepID=UPI003EB6EBCB
PIANVAPALLARRDRVLCVSEPADGLLGRRASLVRSVGVHSALNHCLNPVLQRLCQHAHRAKTIMF